MLKPIFGNKTNWNISADIYLTNTWMHLFLCHEIQTGFCLVWLLGRLTRLLQCEFYKSVTAATSASHTSRSVCSVAIPQKSRHTRLPHRFLISVRGLLSVQLCPASVCSALGLHTHTHTYTHTHTHTDTHTHTHTHTHAHTLVPVLCLFPAESKSALLKMYFNPHSSAPPLPPRPTQLLIPGEHFDSSPRWRTWKESREEVWERQMDKDSEGVREGNKEERGKTSNTSSTWVCVYGIAERISPHKLFFFF